MGTIEGTGITVGSTCLHNHAADTAKSFLTTGELQELIHINTPSFQGG